MSVALCLVAIFASVGVVFTISSVLRMIFCRHSPNPCIVIGVKNHGESIEGIVRLLMKQHPKSEIMIIDYGSEDDTPEIIDKLCKDYDCIHKKN